MKSEALQDVFVFVPSSQSFLSSLAAVFAVFPQHLQVCRRSPLWLWFSGTVSWTRGVARISGRRPAWAAGLEQGLWAASKEEKKREIYSSQSSRNRSKEMDITCDVFGPADLPWGGTTLMSEELLSVPLMFSSLSLIIYRNSFKTNGEKTVKEFLAGQKYYFD